MKKQRMSDWRDKMTENTEEKVDLEKTVGDNRSPPRGVDKRARAMLEE